LKGDLCRLRRFFGIYGAATDGARPHNKPDLTTDWLAGLAGLALPKT